VSLEIPQQSNRLSVFASLENSPELNKLASEIRSRRTAILSGLAGSARALVLALLQKKTERPFACVTQNMRALEDLQRDIQFFYCLVNGLASPEGDVQLFPASEHNPYDGTSPHPEVMENRALTLFRLTQQQPKFVLMPMASLVQRTIRRDELARHGATLTVTKDKSPEELVDVMIASGYVREDPVTDVGQFSLRGGILDVFSPSSQNPVRVEFFGDTVETIREFDPETQRSIRKLDSCDIIPLREFVASRTDLRNWAESAADYWAEEKYSYELRGKSAAAIDGETFAGWEYLFALERPPQSSIFEYLQGAVLVIDEPTECDKRTADMLADLELRFNTAQDAGELALPPSALFLTPEELRSQIAAIQRLEFRLLGQSAASTDSEFALDGIITTDQKERSGTDDAEPRVDSPEPAPTPLETISQIMPKRQANVPLFLFPTTRETLDVYLGSQSVRRFHGHIDTFAQELRQLGQARAQSICVMPSLGVAERLVEMFREYSLPADLWPDTCDSDQNDYDVDRQQLAFLPAVVTIGKLSNGFAIPKADLSFFTEPDLFDETTRVVELRQTKPTKKRPKSAAFVSDFRDLKPGDYVVHIDHGIGQFQGLQQLDVPNSSGRGSTPREFMLLTFSEGAKLFVPVERLDLVQKYSSAESGHTPPLDKLGGVVWQKTKARAKKAIRDMADELLKLYAERQLVGGHAFSIDGPWQHEFEDAFEYQLTPDQETSITDVKSDMEDPKPMDRLLCGDVGYGKTEVAMRAAFKAVMDGKQVAVLAPTTVLSYQHYKTFKSRFAAFPVQIELMSRFRSSKENKETATKVAAGEIDVLVGTHRLLSKDVEFKDLGLVVVDEEQRFGVAHKERLKHLKKKVDVLTMTATPIPRTLNMSLMGLRDMSLIETPPRDRLAIQTSVVQFSEPVIRSAVEMELQRGGQVFFIHNRVESIFTIAELLNRITPNAKLGVAHGQMGEKDLEAVMMKFIQGDLNVLVATTIIENGIDIPLANTIIINRADAYGLSQLYQLRGRVGRSNRHAYAYLIIPSEQELSPIARRRLAAIREFSDLGAGFRIAALDLELRGAGSLLGGQQSGHIDAIGFDLYTAMLERAVHELKGEVVEDETRSQLNLGVDIRLPEDYISEIGQRLRAYKRISSARDEETLTEIQSEMEDRYGRLPESAANLYEYARLRQVAESLGVLSIDRKGDDVHIKFSENAKVDPDKLLSLIEVRKDASFSPGGVLHLALAGSDPMFDRIKSLLHQLRQ